jgi:hypothetical protein
MTGTKTTGTKDEDEKTETKDEGYGGTLGTASPTG